jgi:hypothetical protein
MRNDHCHIDELAINELRIWFEDYLKSFPLEDPDLKYNISLKKDHTIHVCDEIVGLGQDLGLKKKDLVLAEIMALFHDIGRFEQYLLYRTFVDAKSVNHALFGVEILRDKDVLALLDDPTKDLILRVISCHNAATLPENEDSRCIFFAKLLRDADKLDIYRVVTDYYTDKDGMSSRALELDLPDLPETSQHVLEDFMAQKVINHAQLRTLNDFKILQLAWIFDINFTPTLRRVRDRGYLEAIRGSLPDNHAIEKVFSLIDFYVNERAQMADQSPLCI